MQKRIREAVDIITAGFEARTGLVTGPNKIKFIGRRPGEKIHEEMVSNSDAHNTYEYKNYFIIFNLCKCSLLCVIVCTVHHVY